MITLLAAAFLALAAAGCGWLPWLGRAKEPTAKEVLGVDDDRFKELDEEAIDIELARAKNGLRVTIRTDKPAYQLGEPIIVDIRLENVSAAGGGQNARDIPVYFEPVVHTRDGRAVEWLFKFQIRTDRDMRLVYRSPDVKVPLDARDDYYHYVVLPPQSFVGRRFIFSPRQARGLTNPGRYSLMASYAVGDDSAQVIISNRLTDEQAKLLTDKIAYVRVWTGQIFSNRVTFDVKRKKFLGLF